MCGCQLGFPTWQLALIVAIELSGPIVPLRGIDKLILALDRPDPESDWEGMFVDP
jgi:hypothetical protein